MSHAKLYCLANYVLLPSLEKLALYRLASTMSAITRFSLGRERSAAVLEVARYLYENTCHLDDGQEPALDFVSSFIALKLDLLDDTVVKQLISEGGDCVGDIVGHVKKGMSETGVDLWEFKG